MVAIQFRFGLHHDGHPVSILDAVKGEKYTCINCGKPLIAKQGAVRKWHFAHKTNTSNCSYETYLHKLSKFFIREMFNEKQQLIVFREKKTQTCDREHVCPFKKDKNCSIIEEERIDLLQYDNCIEEMSIKGFVADLLFTSDTLEPLLIEICVTHPCTIEKIESGLKIIEIHIESETDVLELLEGKLIESEKIVFHNFQNDCRGHNLFHGYEINSHFEEKIENCKESFWPNQDYSWELYAEEKTKSYYDSFKIDFSRSFCNTCAYFSVKSRSVVGYGMCLFPGNNNKRCFVNSCACQHFLFEIDISSVLHQPGLSVIFHHPNYRFPQRLLFNSTV